MNARLRMYKYCYSNEGAIYAKGLYDKVTTTYYPFFAPLNKENVQTFSP